ncbi:hypothetical protein DFH94DRAFT_776787 [Russula ochroleuca]|uniref:Uncharacterized protein n=1 Tax=Russula ochroleuca TaxID=152965 RepID=A0A9P5JXV4_9AGAM|nr:hypothetical protein DFH94DRAFT_776787 [Russula ochroleuca]
MWRRSCPKKVARLTHAAMTSALVTPYVESWLETRDLIKKYPQIQGDGNAYYQSFSEEMLPKQIMDRILGMTTIQQTRRERTA